jgi:thiosulfate/3-mercaptopyruvate sulfurtransferase
MTEAFAHPETIVSTDWVAEHLNDPSVVVVEIDADLGEDYDQGHIPGAVGWDLHKDLEDVVTRDIPSIHQFEALMGRSGIAKDTMVVLYGDGNNRSATWACWKAGPCRCSRHLLSRQLTEPVYPTAACAR